MEPSFAKVLEHFDNSATAIAAAVGGGVQRQNVEYWIATGRVPKGHRPAVERAMRGAVTCDDLSSDGVVWARIADKTWPWHKRGRPVLDVTKAAA